MIPDLAVPLTLAQPTHGRASRKGLGVLGVLAAVVLIGLTQWPHYAGTAVCRECGIRSDSYLWETRFGHRTLYRFVRANSTAVSRALHLPSHRHKWTQSLIPPTEPANTEQTLPNLLYSVESPRVASFVANLGSTNPDVLEKWKRLILDPRYSLVMDSSLHYMRFPNGGFSSSSAFRSWWQGAEYPLWNHLRELTEPD